MSEFFRGHTSRFMAASVAALAVLAAACTPGSDDDDKPKAKSPQAINTDPAKAGKVTLTVWDQEVQKGQNEHTETLNKAFQQKYPNVTIKRTSRSFSDLNKTLKLALSGDNPPDVVQANQGYPIMGAFVKAGMIVPLDPYDQVYGWRKRFPKALTDINSFSTDGKKFGQGSLYGMSNKGEIVGIYYNAEKLRKLGIQQPATWAQFEQALGTAKSKGETPIAFGNVEKFPGFHDYGVIQDQVASKQAVRDLVFGRSGSWTDQPNVQAADKLASWAKQGYFTKNANAVKYDDSPANFGKGQGVFFIAGTWFAADLGKSMKDNVRFMLPPPAQQGGNSVTVGGESLAWSITAKSKNQDVAAAYINFLHASESMDVAAEAGELPVLKPPSKVPSSQLMRDIFEAWSKVSQSDGLTPYIDYATPTFPDALGGALQKVIGGKASGRKAMDEAQKDYSAFLKKN